MQAVPIRGVLRESAPGRGAVIDMTGSLRMLLRLEHERPLNDRVAADGFERLLETYPRPLQLVVRKRGRREQAFLALAYPAPEALLGQRAAPGPATRSLSALVAALARPKMTALDQDQIEIGRAALERDALDLTAALVACGVRAVPVGREEAEGLLERWLSPAPEETETAARNAEGLSRTFFFAHFPGAVMHGWLAGALAGLEADVDAALYLQPLEPRGWARRMRQMIAVDETAITRSFEEGRQPEAERQWRAAHGSEMVALVERGETRPFHVGVFVSVFGADMPALEQAAAEVERTFAPVGLRQAGKRHAPGYLTTLPLLFNRLAENSAVRFLHTQGAATLFPLSGSR